MSALVSISWLIPLLPLLAAAVAGFAGKRYLRGASHWPIWLGVGTSAVLSLAILAAMLMTGTNARVQFTDAYRQTVEANPTILDPEGRYASYGDGRMSSHAPDEDVKLYTSTWFTWIAAGDRQFENIPPSLTPQQAADLAVSRSAAGAVSGVPAGTGGEEVTGGYFRVAAGALLDPLSAVMLGVVCGIGFLITVFAAGYMKGETGYWRFFAYLGLFIFSMTCLVMGENLIMLYLGWEGVGLCSYLLIGYYYDKPAAREAAKKAFLVNRVGDFGFAVGIMLIWWCYGTVSYFGDAAVIGDGFVEMATNPAAYVPLDRQWALPYIPFALMLGAFGKSAQFPLYVWLPDAMEGPTPVSALIHAATMVTAGVYMIARLNPLFAAFPAALVTITVVGTFTALFAATIALRQFDLKKVFAYSTVSQLGYMFVAVGVLAPMAGVFHLVTHAFFKALLFLSSGVVMHAMMGHLDMRRMSGLKTVLPKTRLLCLVGCLALAGFPLTSGFFSKDEIIHFAHLHTMGDWVGYLLWFLLLLTAFLTAYYTFRLYFRVFEGPTVVPSEPAPGHGHDDSHGTSSAAAVMTGDAAQSGIDAPHGQSPAAIHDHAADSPREAAGHDTHDDHAHGHGGHGHDGHHDHEPAVMMIPLLVLAVGALVAGFFQFPFHWLGAFLGDSASFVLGFDVAVQTFGNNPVKPIPGAYGYEVLSFGAYLTGLLPGFVVGGIIAISGIALAWFLHLRHRDKAVGLAHTFRPFANLLEGKYYVDEIYDAVVVRPLRGLGRVFFGVDRFLIDGLVWAVGNTPVLGGAVLRIGTQRGALQGYALSMLLGVALLIAAVALL